jgi:hypothetical protein
LRRLESLSIFEDLDEVVADMAALTALTALTNFHLYVDNIVGDVPALNQLPRLRSVSAYVRPSAANQYDMMLKNAASITRLWLSIDHARGQPSLLRAVTTLGNLRKLHLGCSCKVMLPIGITALSSLTKLVLSYTCGIPARLFSLTTLQHLELFKRGDCMHETALLRLPRDVTRLQHLRVLYLPMEMQLCRQVTTLRQLEFVEADIALSGDAEHAQAVAQLERTRVRLRPLRSYLLNV